MALPSMKCSSAASSPVLTVSGAWYNIFNFFDCRYSLSTTQTCVKTAAAKKGCLYALASDLWTESRRRWCLFEGQLSMHDWQKCQEGGEAQWQSQEGACGNGSSL